MSTTIYNYKLLVCNYGNAYHGTHQWNSKGGNPDRGSSLYKPHPQHPHPLTSFEKLSIVQHVFIHLLILFYLHFFIETLWLSDISIQQATALVRKLYIDFVK